MTCQNLPKDVAQTPPPEEEGASPRLLVHLMDYLASDYAGAVKDGKILSKSEYQEQVEFSESAQNVAARIAPALHAPELAAEATRLRALIAAKKSPAEVSDLARRIQSEVLTKSGLEVAPQSRPNLVQGKSIFQNNCVQCHGVDGRGDGPVGKDLAGPKPANFHSEKMAELSPFQAFNVVRLGVPGTGMQAFPSLSDREVWEVATYVLSLRYQGQNPSPRALAEAAKIGLAESSTLSDKKLEERLGSVPPKDRAAVIAALRLSSGGDAGGGGSDQGGDSAHFALARSKLESALAEYRNQHRAEAKQQALLAYLDGVEPIEPRLRARDADLVTRIEENFASVRSSIESGRSPEGVAHEISQALASLNQAQKELGEGIASSPWLTFSVTAGIFFREAFEAVLILLALLGVIRAAGSRRAEMVVHVGWVLALGVGAVAWFFSGWVMSISGAQRELMEGFTSLLAVVVLLYLGFWLHSKTEIHRWRAFVEGKVRRALEGGNLWGLGVVAFMAVFRECLETVLFLRAVWLEGGSADKAAMAWGVLGSLGLIFVLAWALLRYSVRLPMRQLFDLSSMVMIVLSVILIGKGLHSLQEVGLLSVNTTPWHFTWSIVGLYPSYECFVAQLLTAILGVSLWQWGSRQHHASRLGGDTGIKAS